MKIRKDVKDNDYLSKKNGWYVSATPGDRIVAIYHAPDNISHLSAGSSYYLDSDNKPYMRSPNNLEKEIADFYPGEL